MLNPAFQATHALPNKSSSGITELASARSMQFAPRSLAHIPDPGKFKASDPPIHVSVSNAQKQYKVQGEIHFFSHFLQQRRD